MTRAHDLATARISRRDLLSRAATGALVAGSATLVAPLAVRATGAARPLPTEAFDASTATAWFDLVLDLVRETPGYTPPVASRAIGYVGVTMYEAVVGGMPDHRGLHHVLPGIPATEPAGRSAAFHWPTVACGALAELVRHLFATAPPERLADVGRLESAAWPAVPRGMRERSTTRGRTVAQAVLAWARADGGHDGHLRNFPTDYVPPAGPGQWEPTPPSFLPALQPWWGANRRFVPDPGGCQPAAPTAFSTDPRSPCFLEALEVHDTVASLTDAQVEIARFWADDPGRTATPPGHSLAILAQLLRDRPYASLADAAEAGVLLGMAVADAFIDCWATKYRHNYLRPITYIRRHIDPAWGDPLPVVTPPFPEFTSGHSVQSGAAAAVLTSLFGTVAFTDRTHDRLGLSPRSFASFEAAADEAATSRLYGGIHFRPAIEDGLVQGRCIGTAVAALPLRA